MSTTATSNAIEATTFQQSLLALLSEAFGTSGAPSSMFLDSVSAGLLPTVSSLSAEQASRAVAPGRTTIAAQCGHVLFLLQLFAAAERGESPEADWAGSWSRATVTAVEWKALQAELRALWGSVAERLRGKDGWPEARVQTAMLLLTHCTYHVGAIRQLMLQVAE